MRRLAVLFAALLAMPAWARDPLVIIVNPESGVTRLTRQEVENIYMGRQRRLPSGLMALPVEEMFPAETRLRFYQTLVHLPMPEVRAYWARMYFSGQCQPPRQTETAEETLEVIAANKGAIGFLARSKVDRRVRVVLELEPSAEP